MVVQVVNGIVSRTYTLHVIVLHQSASRELGLLQLLVTLVENLAGGLGAQQLLNTKGGLQLQMCPVIQRVTQCIGHRFSPLLKLLPVASVLTRAVLLVNAIGTHGAPLVVVAAQPKFGNALEAMVVSHHFGNKMTMVIDDGHLSRMIVVQVLSYLSLQHEIFVVKCFHFVCICFR